MGRRVLSWALAFALCLGCLSLAPQTALAWKDYDFAVLWEGDLTLWADRFFANCAYENTVLGGQDTESGLFRFDGDTVTQVLDATGYLAGAFGNEGEEHFRRQYDVSDDGLFLTEDYTTSLASVVDYTGKVLAEDLPFVKTNFVSEDGWIVVREGNFPLTEGKGNSYALNVKTGEKKDTNWGYLDPACYDDYGIDTYNDGIYATNTSLSSYGGAYYNDEGQRIFEGYHGTEFNYGYAIAWKDAENAEVNPSHYQGYLYALPDRGYQNPVILCADGEKVIDLPAGSKVDMYTTIWKDGILPVQVGDEIKFYNVKGEQAFSTGYKVKRSGDFRNGYVPVVTENGFTVFDGTGEELLTPGYLEYTYEASVSAVTNVTSSGLIWIQLTSHESGERFTVLMDLDVSKNNNHFDGTPSQPGNDTTPAPTDAPTPSTPSRPTSFPDVKPGDWFYDCVMDMVSMGAVSGLPDGTFAPDQAITTGELITLAMNLMPGKKCTPQEIQDFKKTSGAPDLSGYWAENTVLEAMITRGIDDYTITSNDRDFWTGKVSRLTTIQLIYHIYNNSNVADGKDSTEPDTYSIIGDIAKFKGDYRAPYAYWAYNNGIVTGVNANGDFNPFGTLTRAEACGILSHVIHPETRAKVDWDHVHELDALLEDPNALHRLPDGVDSFGNTRIHYAEDTAYDFCRELEEKIGIPIYYLPEFTVASTNLFSPTAMAKADPINKFYFDDIRTELAWMDQAYDLLPEGMIKEVAGKKYHKNTEIILTTHCYFEGASQFGCYNYDYSDNPVKVDQIFYTGAGDVHFYIHELGHMITGSMGGNAFNSAWEELYNKSRGYITTYAASSNLEDIAETWAYSWIVPDQIVNLVKSGEEPMFIKKIQLLTDMLDEKLETFDAASAPWAEILP